MIKKKLSRIEQIAQIFISVTRFFRPLLGIHSSLVSFLLQRIYQEPRGPLVTSTTHSSSLLHTKIQKFRPLYIYIQRYARYRKLANTQARSKNEGKLDELRGSRGSRLRAVSGSVLTSDGQSGTSASCFNSRIAGSVPLNDYLRLDYVDSSI